MPLFFFSNKQKRWARGKAGKVFASYRTERKLRVSAISGPVSCVSKVLVAKSKGRTECLLGPVPQSSGPNFPAHGTVGESLPQPRGRAQTLGSGLI